MTSGHTLVRSVRLGPGLDHWTWCPEQALFRWSKVDKSLTESEAELEDRSWKEGAGKKTPAKLFCHRKLEDEAAAARRPLYLKREDTAEYFMGIE